ncbi:MAG: GNAT family N-acetyltransferase [Rhizobiaceae bacterium]|nr:GNAT family N-acetyltransferase [Rhizobiaceae bacterium]
MSNMDDPKKLLNMIRGIHDDSWGKDARILASHAGIDSSAWTLGLLSSLQHAGLRKQVMELASLQNHPNPFFELPILEPAIEHLAHGEMQFLYLSERVGNHEILKMFAPARFEKTMLARQPVLRVWTQKYGPLGQPLMEREHSGPIIDALINCLSNPASPEPLVILFNEIPVESDLCETLYNAPSLSDRLVRFSNRFRGAYYPVSGSSYEETHVSGKRRQRFRVAMNRLQEKHGPASFERSTDPQQTVSAMEELLTLEARGWKGKRGTALLARKKDVAFARESVSAMAANGQCEIFSMKADGRMLASVVLFSSGGYYFPWKTAYDEQYAAYSVGNLLMNHMNQTLSSEPGFKGLDSLADSCNTTARRLWPDLRQVCSLSIGMGEGASDYSCRIRKELLAERKARKIARKLLRR